MSEPYPFRPEMARKNCRPECETDCPPMAVGSGPRCKDYREELRDRLAQLGRDVGVDIPFRLQKLGVPADAILGVRSPTTTQALEAAKRFRAAPHDLVRTLLLSGSRGVGKSVAAAWVLAQAIRGFDENAQPSGGKRFPPFIWCNAAEVTGVVDFGKVSPDWVDGLKACRLLVVDDLGEEGTTVVGVAALADVLKTRHEKHRRTVITTNIPLEAPKSRPDSPTLSSRYGASWWERLKVAAIAPNLANEKSLRTKGKP